jgi:hypothetical protein
MADRLNLAGADAARDTTHYHAAVPSGVLDPHTTFAAAIGRAP